MTHSIDVFKHILFRIAGESFSLLAKNKEIYAFLENELKTIARLEQEKQASRIAICDSVYLLVNTVDDAKAQKQLINFKRDFFNGRNISEAKLNEVIQLFTPEISTLYNSYTQVDAELHRSIQHAKELLDNAYEADLAFIREVCSRNNIKNGLLLSSELLLKYAESFANDSDKIDESTILGLWKYATRTVAKTTPFSTFTQLNIGTLSPSGPAFDFGTSGFEVRSVLRYNNYILEMMLTLIKKHPVLFRSLNITVNPTLEKKDSELIFFTNNKNIESFQRIKNNGIINYIVDKLSQEKELIVSDLVDDLLSVLDEKYTRADVEKYIFELVQTGLLFVNINLSGLDSEWDKSLHAFFQKVDGVDKLQAESINILEELIQLKDEYGLKNVAERADAIKSMNTFFNELFVRLQEDDDEGFSQYNYIKSGEDLSNVFLHRLPTKRNNVTFRNIIYEDTTLNTRISVSDKKINDFLNKVNRIILSFTFICKTNHDRIEHYDFYQKNFQGSEKVSLLTFYEQLYKFKTSATNEENQQPVNNSNNNDAATIDRIKKLISAQQQAGNVRMENGFCGVNDLFFDALDKEFKELAPRKTNINYGTFTQFYLDDTMPGEDLKGVINGGIMPGRGKMISRFLHLFDDEVTEDLKFWNAAYMPPDEVYVENSDASFFNANLHPCLMPYEIEIPGGNTRSANNLINIADLHIKPDTEQKELVLFNDSGQKVSVYDLGFQTLLMRSLLYRLLCSFGNNYGFPLHTINGLFNGVFLSHIPVEGMDVKIIVAPRLTFMSSVILQRKQWTIPCQVIAAILKKHQSTDLYALYTAFHRWKDELHIPNEVFVRLYHNHNVQQNKEGQQNQQSQLLNKDDYKPQYLNLLSPMGFRLFIKLVGKMKAGNIVIEEMLPCPENALTINGEKKVTETLIQWQSQTV